MKTTLDSVTMDTHTGMAVAHYLDIMRKYISIKDLATKMKHADTGLIYRRVKQAEPDFEFMVNIMEAFDSPALLEYVPKHVKEMLKHHANVKHPEWFSEGKETAHVANEPNEPYGKSKPKDQNSALDMERLQSENEWLRKLTETQTQLIELLKKK